MTDWINNGTSSEATTWTEQFRLDFPEFTDESVYSNDMINFWYGIGIKTLNVNRWGDRINYGLELFVAHNICLQVLDSKTALASGVPGTGSGVISGQGAGGINVSIDSQASIENGGGAYNLSVYGTRFIRLSRLMGIGGLQL